MAAAASVSLGWLAERCLRRLGDERYVAGSTLPVHRPWASPERLHCLGFVERIVLEDAAKKTYAYRRTEAGRDWLASHPG